jgi:hypothetical protein
VLTTQSYKDCKKLYQIYLTNENIFYQELDDFDIIYPFLCDTQLLFWRVGNKPTTKVKQTYPTVCRQ